MGGDLQKRLIPLFHYALNPGAFLFLGSSETIGDFNNLFETLDRKSKLYRSKAGLHSLHHAGMSRYANIEKANESLPLKHEKTTDARKPSLRELTEQAMLEHVVQVGALVNGQGDILYIHGRSGLYLEPTPGETGTNNILKMAREGLHRDLANAFHKAVGTKETVHCPGLRVKTNGDFTKVNLTVRPVTTVPTAKSETPLYLVILEEARSSDQEKNPKKALHIVRATDSLDAETDERVIALKQELRAKEEYLQTAIEELETSNEELRSSNEEMQSINEELQSTNEELETSKEELQSVNEELATVNVELQTKVADLSRANNDMNNLLAGTGIATVFVDHGLHILRFTPSATRIINLILSDVGRPVGHVVNNLVGYDRLVEDIRSVLNSLIPKELEVRSQAGAWYMMRIQPYRTLDNVIEGAVITFVDITRTKTLEEQLQAIGIAGGSRDINEHGIQEQSGAKVDAALAQKDGDE
jgi:two-component system, chemotaxis family, CheB/CheR fusion protein